MSDEEKDIEFVSRSASELALFESLLRSRGIPVQLRDSSAYRGNGIRIPYSHAHLARKFFREYERKEKIREITPEEYSRNQKKLLLLVTISLAVGLFIAYLSGQSFFR